jgi:hypothetical protein
MIEEKIARVKALIQKREEIDAELAAIFGGGEVARRGRPRKEPAGHADGGNGAVLGNRTASAAAPDSSSSTPSKGP